MATIRVKSDYLTIQEAVNVASPGDVVLVEPGMYTESVFISNKISFTIVADGQEVRVAPGLKDGNIVGDCFLLFKCRNVECSGFTCSDAYPVHDRANTFELLLNGSPSTGSIYRYEYRGRKVSGYKRKAGIHIVESNNTRIKNLYGYSCDIGLYIKSDNNVWVEDFHVRNCGESGVRIESSSNIFIENGVTHGHGVYTNSVYSRPGCGIDYCKVNVVNISNVQSYDNSIAAFRGYEGDISNPSYYLNINKNLMVHSGAPFMINSSDYYNSTHIYRKNLMYNSIDPINGHYVIIGEHKRTGDKFPVRAFTFEEFERYARRLNPASIENTKLKDWPYYQ